MIARPFRALPSLSILALCALAGALAERTEEASASPESEVRFRGRATASGELLTLTPLHSPALAALGHGRELVSVHELVARTQLAGGSASLQEHLAGVWAIAIDGQALGQRELDPLERAVLRGAEQLDVPVVVEGMDGESQSELLGFGVDAPVVVHRGLDVHPLGGGEFAAVPLQPMSRQDIAQRVRELLGTPPTRARSGGSLLPHWSYQLRTVTLAADDAYVTEYVPHSVEIPPPAEFSIVFEVEWWFESGKKYCAINTKGAGFVPKQYVHQEPDYQGYYQDQLFVSYGPGLDQDPDPTSLELLDYSPRNLPQHQSVGHQQSTDHGFSGGISYGKEGPTGSLDFSSSSSKGTSNTYDTSELTHLAHTWGPDGDSVHFFAGMNKSYTSAPSFTPYLHWSDLITYKSGAPTPMAGLPGFFQVPTGVVSLPVLNVPVLPAIVPYHIYSAASWVADGGRTDSTRFDLVVGQRLIDLQVQPSQDDGYVLALLNGATTANSTSVWVDWGKVAGAAGLAFLGEYGISFAPSTTPQYLLVLDDASGGQVLGDLWIGGHPFPVAGAYATEPDTPIGHVLLTLYADPLKTFPLATFYVKPSYLEGAPEQEGYEGFLGLHIGSEPGPEHTKLGLYGTPLELYIQDVLIQ